MLTQTWQVSTSRVSPSFVTTSRCHESRPIASLHTFYSSLVSPGSYSPIFRPAAFFTFRIVREPSCVCEVARGVHLRAFYHEFVILQSVLSFET